MQYHRRQTVEGTRDPQARNGQEEGGRRSTRHRQYAQVVYPKPQDETDLGARSKSFCHGEAQCSGLENNFQERRFPDFEKGRFGVTPFLRYL